ncbi:MAG: hypothetical protein VW644_10900, partial [Alphaproteobacteria bacterium]
YQDPHPPVFVSGSGSPETIDYAAKMGFIPTYFTNIDTAAPLGKQYAEAATKAGFNWNPGQNQNIVRWLQIAESYDAAIDDVIGSMLSSGLYCIGTAESVRDQLVAQWEQMPAEYITLIYHYAQMPKDKVIQNMREFNEVVKPALDEVTANAGHDVAQAAE